MEPKLIYLARRNPALTRSGFTARWRQHGALGMSMPRWKNIRRYVHCDVQQYGISGIDEGYDGVGLIWHRSPEARSRHRSDNSSQAQMEADEAQTFAEPVYNFCLLAQEFVLKDGLAGAVKLIHFAERATLLGKKEFEKAWRESHTNALLGDSEIGPAIQRYVQNHALPPERPGGWGLTSDCVDEFWFAPAENLPSVFARLKAETQGSDLLRRSIWVATNEVVLHDRPEIALGPD